MEDLTMRGRFNFESLFRAGKIAVVAEGEDLYIEDEDGNEFDFLSLLPRSGTSEDLQSGGSGEAHLVCAPAI